MLSPRVALTGSVAFVGWKLRQFPVGWNWAAAVLWVCRHHGEGQMDVDLPQVVREVKEAFDRYEQALVSNDVSMFRDDPRSIRYGVAENLYGHGEIKSFRAARSPAGLARSLSRTVITTFGRDFAVALTLFRRNSLPGKVGRQMQTWVRFPEGWRIVAAHVSAIDEPSEAAHG
jgi:AtzH-like